MREFRCSSLGYQCSWKHIATEELLADMVALHLRDVHGVKAVDSAMVGKIKNLFSYPKESDAAVAADLVMKEYNCDMGPGCTWRYIAMTEELIADGAAVHAREKHGIKDFSPEMIARVKRSIHNWAGEEKRTVA
jgi:predicted small metal-binding protein